VQFRPNCFGVAAALAIAGALCGCANVDFETQNWFSKPLDVLGQKGGFTYSELQETSQQRVITASDLVDASGACPAPPVAAPAGGPNFPAQTSPPTSATSSLLGGGIALGMSECDVVHRAGQPGSVQLGNAPNGDRTALMTINGGPRPGIYRFAAGRLMQIDRVETLPTQPQTVKKKPAQPKKPPSNAA
jgi:hypothetical protein